jgi:catechol 2,3-dioxygenase-like lactoylglutathione lyase family enzyme
MYTTSYVTLMVADMDRSIKFYVDEMGLDLKSRHGDFWAEVQAPDVLIGLHPLGDSSEKPTAGSVSIGFIVEDFASAVKTLKDRHVDFDTVTETVEASSAYLTDPDGYQLYIMWRAAR